MNAIQSPNDSTIVAEQHPLWMFKKADAITVNGGPLLSSWDTEDWEDDPDNEVVMFSWEDREFEWSIKLTERGVLTGLWTGNKLVCQDHEGEFVEIAFFQLQPMLPESDSKPFIVMNLDNGGYWGADGWTRCVKDAIHMNQFVAQAFLALNEGSQVVELASAKDIFEVPPCKIGDEIFWNDPDHGICSGHYRIAGIADPQGNPTDRLIFSGYDAAFNLERGGVVVAKALLHETSIGQQIASAENT